MWLVATIFDRADLNGLVFILPRYCTTHRLKYVEIIFIHLVMWILDITIKYSGPKKI